MADRYSTKTLLLEIAFLCIALLFLYPLLLVLMNSFKAYSDILLHAADWPKTIIFSNYANAWASINFPKVLLNSLTVTVCSNAGIVVLSSMAAWRLARYPGRWSHALFLLFISAMVIPFQSIMIPIVQVGGKLGLVNRLFGLILMYWGLGVSFTMFLYHGFTRSIPIEIEESATMDGCGTQALFWRIVFPLLTPMTVTALILNSLWIWNDFLLPAMILQDHQLHTIPLAIYSFFAQYSQKWDLALATLVMSIAPIVAFFLIMQKYVIRGIMAGSVKG
jgi:raffinose/stachyose/melibiose transport system permease protein